MVVRDAAACCALVFVTLACGGETYSLGRGRQVESVDGGQGPTAVQFDEPQPIAALDDASADDDDPSLTFDRLELYFNSERPGGEGEEDVWYTTRATLDASWAAPRPASELNTEDRETGIALSADGLTVWFSSDRENGTGGLDVYMATRPNRTTPFGEVLAVEELNTSGDELVSAVDATAQTLLLARREDEDDDYDLFMARRSLASGPWEAPQPLASLNSEREESDGFAAGAGALLVFTRAGELTLAQRDVGGQYLITRALDELNSDGDDRDAWATEDLSYVVFASDRSGSYLLYEARARAVMP